jgi:hypothetical protein
VEFWSRCYAINVVVKEEVIEKRKSSCKPAISLREVTRRWVVPAPARGDVGGKWAQSQK